MNREYKLKYTAICLGLVCLLVDCNKLVQIPQPINTITAEKTFSNNIDANSAIAGIYGYMILGGTSTRFIYANGLTTICAGASADELRVTAFLYSSFEQNAILPSDNYLSSFIWAPLYYNIYQANSAIENLQSSVGVSDSVKIALTAEAKFIRAFCHFYLVNLFGDVPLITKSAWASINTMSRTPAEEVYQQIIQDLKDAEAGLPADYSAGGGEKIRANRWAAAALLARVYLYHGEWQNAEAEAGKVIESSAYQLVGDLNSVFLKNSDEAILQLQTINANKYSVPEAYAILPISHTSSPSYVLTDNLLAAFEPDDARRKSWVDSTIYRGTTYFYPNKYKVKIGEADNITEYYMLLRYAEQYLIRAEARAQQGTNLTGAIDDLNALRLRANLLPLDESLSQSQVIDAVTQERRIELFAEWGHRWLDLKRTGKADAVLSAQKPGWTPNAKLWPIPLSELTRDPFLTQNPGYN